jgi:hypothetical protein
VAGLLQQQDQQLRGLVLEWDGIAVVAQLGVLQVDLKSVETQAAPLAALKSAHSLQGHEYIT